MRIKVIRPSLSNISIGRYAKLFALAIISAVLISAIAIALPYTETVNKDFGYDLILKENQYKSRVYILQFDVSLEDPKFLDQNIERSKDVLMRRLKQFGVEVVTISDYENSESEEAALAGTNLQDPLDALTEIAGDIGELSINAPGLEELISNENEQTGRSKYEYIQIEVDTSKDLGLVSQLIQTRSFLRIVTPKAESDFTNPDDQIAQYLPENYDDTQFTRYSFRTITVRELPTSTGDRAYFGVYKINLNERGEFRKLLKQYAGKSIGIRTDGFVTPFQVPIDFAATAAQLRSTNPEFAPLVAQNSTDAQVANLLLNAGVIPLSYTVYDQTDIASSMVRPDYPTAFLAVLAGIIATLLFVSARNRSLHDQTILFLSSAVLTFSLWLAFLKFFAIPVDLEIIILTGFILIYIVTLLTYKSGPTFEYEGAILLIGLTFAWLTSGFVGMLAWMIVEVTLVAILSVTIMRFYLNNLRKYLL